MAGQADKGRKLSISLKVWGDMWGEDPGSLKNTYISSNYNWLVASRTGFEPVLPT